MKYNLFYQQKGETPGKVEAWSRYNDPIPNDGQPHGNSRRHGDASPAVQEHVINTIISECLKRGLSREDTAHVLAIARVESGFNPDAAAGTSSASGVGQFIRKTGSSYGLTDANRFDLVANTRALVGHYLDNKALALENGKDAAWVYKYHHDGPTLNSGGLGLAVKEVLPYARAYSTSPLLSGLEHRAQDVVAGVKRQAQAVVQEVKQLAQGVVREVQQRVEPLFEQWIPRTGPSRYITEDWRAVSPPPEAPAAETQTLTPTSQPANAPAGLQSSSGVEQLPATASSSGAMESALSKDAAPALADKSGPGAEQLAALNARPALSDQAGRADLPPGESYGVTPSGTTISLAQALASHMTEKGFDAASVAQAPALALHVLEGTVLKDTEASALVLHKAGDALASLATKPEADVFAKAGDSVLVLANLEHIALKGLDTDAVASLRGLAPTQTQPHSDLEVHQAAPAALYAKALDPDAPLNSPSAVKELVAGLDAFGAREGFADGARAAQQETKSAEAKEAQQSAEMSMST
jgi:hypothetical protein